MATNAPASAKVPRRRPGRDRVASLLDAAAAVFARAGYDAATMTEIAAVAGASIGSLYQFFPTKVVLAHALYQREMATLAHVLRQAGTPAQQADRTLPAVADRLFVALVAFCRSHPALPAVADRHGLYDVPKAEPRPGMRKLLADLLRQSDPKPSPKQVNRAAVLVLMMMQGAIAVGTQRDKVSRILMEDARAMLNGHLRTWTET